MSRQQSVLVTGDQGYIGTVLTAVLLERGYQVIGLDNRYFTECLSLSGRNELSQVRSRYP